MTDDDYTGCDDPPELTVWVEIGDGCAQQTGIWVEFDERCDGE